MHITDKEKKAIYEAMKQIRENQKLDEVVGPIAHYASFVKGVSDLPRLGGAAAAAGYAIRNATGNTPIGKLGTAGNFAAKKAGKALGDAAQRYKTSRRDVARSILNRNQSPQPDVMREEDLQEQLPTNTIAMNKSVRDMMGRLKSGRGAMDIARFRDGSNEALGASYYGSGALKSYEADRAAGIQSTDAQDMADYIKKRGAGTLRAQTADGDRYVDSEIGMMKPYMQAYVGKGRQR